MHVEIDLYSGRPNPGWSLAAGDGAELLRRVAALPPAGEAGEPDDVLGYRGLSVRVDGDDGPVPAPLAGVVALHVGAAGVVTVSRRAGGGPERRLDAGCALARWLLGRASGQVDEDVRRHAIGQQGPACRP